MNQALSITLWNSEWAEPGTARGNFFRQRLVELSSSVICVTEGYSDLLPDGGHVITSEADYGYPLQVGRRKVLLWSQQPWREVDCLGVAALPSGRFVAGTTDTALGVVRFIGVCIPWRDAHVRTGRRDRQRWQDHFTYLQHLSSILAQRDTAFPAVLLGDFNQRVPRAYQPETAFSALMEALSSDFQLITSGEIPDAPEATIDHLAITSSLQSLTVEYLSRYDASGNPMSDHFGLRVWLQSKVEASRVAGRAG